MSTGGPQRLGRRGRRLRWTVAALTLLGAIGAVGAAWIYRSAQPDDYRPGEQDANITRVLARGVPADAPAPRFVDATADAGLDRFQQFVGERTAQLPEDMGSGAAWGDFDNDGDDDLFIVASGGPLDLPADRRAASQLYENLSALATEIVRAKPAASKGTYVKNIAISSTMGPGIKVDLSNVEKLLD